MDDKDAMKLFGLEAEETASQIELRHKQITAFLNSDTASDGIKGLAGAAKDQFDEALNQAKTSKETQTSNSQDLVKEIKAAVLPQPTANAGELFSDQWWKVYKRVVLLALAVIGVLLFLAGKIYHQAPPDHYEPYTPPYRDPGPSKSNPPFGDVGPPPDQGATISTSTTTQSGGTSSYSSSSSTSQTADSSLNPQPNPHPLVVAPSQRPASFLIGLFWALKDGQDVQAMLSEPVKPSVSLTLAINHTQCPRLDELPADAFEILSETDGTCTVRVKERYFTRENTVNDYSLVSVNGVWKLSDIQPAYGVTP